MFRYRVNKDPLSSCRLKIAKILCQNGTFFLVFSAAAMVIFVLKYAVVRVAKSCRLKG